MTRYAFGLLCGFLLIGAIWYGIFSASLGMFETVPDRKLGTWMKIKRDAIGHRSSRPGIVLAGGSNVLYGLRGSSIESELGRPVINLGAHAALPFHYLVSFWKSGLRRGDLLVLSIEWRFLVRDTGSASDVFVGYLLGGDVNYFSKLPFREQATFAFSSSLERMLLPIAMSKQTNNLYQKSFREWALACDLRPNGDFFGNTVATAHPSAILRFMNAPTSDVVDTPDLHFATGDTDYWRELKSFLDWCRSKNVTVVFVAPSLLARPEFSTPPFRKFFEAAEERYRSLGVPVLTPQRDNFYAASEMYNTIYHLNERGATRRTEKVIPLLLPFVKEPPVGAR